MAAIQEFGVAKEKISGAQWGTQNWLKLQKNLIHSLAWHLVSGDMWVIFNETTDEPF